MLSLVTVSHWLQSNKAMLLLLLILAVGSALRIYDLGAESIWLDESISVRHGGRDVASIIDRSPARNNPPLYWIMLHYWMNFFGNSEVAIRSLSAIFGILAIWITYLVGRELVSRNIGLLAPIPVPVVVFPLY